MDVSGYKANGTLTNMAPATDWVIGGNPLSPGYVLDFGSSGDTETVQLASDVPHLKITGNITLSAWVNFTTSQSNRGIVSKWVSGTQSYLLLVHFSVSNELRFSIRVSSTSLAATTTGTTYNDGNWHMMTGRFNGSNVLLDIDAGITQSVVGDATSGPIDDGDNIVAIGNYGTTSALGFLGMISEPLIWNRSLKNEELLTLYNVPLASFILRQRIVARAPAAGAAKPLIAMLHQRRFPLVP